MYRVTTKHYPRAVFCLATVPQCTQPPRNLSFYKRLSCLIGNGAPGLSPLLFPFIFLSFSNSPHSQKPFWNPLPNSSTLSFQLKIKKDIRCFLQPPGTWTIIHNDSTPSFLSPLQKTEMKFNKYTNEHCSRLIWFWFSFGKVKTSRERKFEPPYEKYWSTVFPFSISDHPPPPPPRNAFRLFISRFYEENSSLDDFDTLSVGLSNS